MLTQQLKFRVRAYVGFSCPWSLLSTAAMAAIHQVNSPANSYSDIYLSRGYAVDTKVNGIRPVGSMYIQDLGIYSH